METEQLPTELTLGQGRNKERDWWHPRIYWKWMCNIPRLTGSNESSAKRKVHTNKYLNKKFGEILYWQLNSTPEISRTIAKGKKKSKCPQELNKTRK